MYQKLMQCYLSSSGEFDGTNIKQESDVGVMTVNDEAYLDNRASPELRMVKDFESTSSFLDTDNS